MMKKPLFNIFASTISNVLRFQLGLEIYEYLKEENLENYREFEFELDSKKNPIKAIEVNFSSQIFDDWENSSQNRLIVKTDKDISADEITGELAGQPFKHKEMTFVYLFSILETYGNSIAQTVNTKFSNEAKLERSWHSGINRYSKKDLRHEFAKSFNLNRVDVDIKFVNLFLELKEKRNTIAHSLKYPEINFFKKDIQSLIIIMCYLYHINDPSKEAVKFHPWQDGNTNCW